MQFITSAQDVKQTSAALRDMMICSKIDIERLLSSRASSAHAVSIWAKSSCRSKHRDSRQSHLDKPPNISQLLLRELQIPCWC